jgi:hypothetical protein
MCRRTDATEVTVKSSEILPAFLVFEASAEGVVRYVFAEA